MIHLAAFVAYCYLFSVIVFPLWWVWRALYYGSKEKRDQ